MKIVIKKISSIGKCQRERHLKFGKALNWDFSDGYVVEYGFEQRLFLTLKDVGRWITKTATTLEETP